MIDRSLSDARSTAATMALCLAIPAAWDKVWHGEPTFWVGSEMSASFAHANNHHS